MALQNIRINCTRVRVLDLGSRKMPAVLLVHGLGGAIESWSSNVDYLARRAHVVALDLPGFGESDKPRIRYTVAYYRDFLASFIKQLGISSASVVGASLGGQIAAELAIARPRLVDKLVLISPAGALPRSFKASPALKRYVRVTSARSAAEVRKALFAVDNKPVAGSYARTVFERFSKPGAKEAFLSALKESASAPRLGPRLAKIRSPTLLLWGMQDTMIPAKFAEPFMKIRNCRVVLLERCGHRPHAERPELFNDIVSRYLAE